jgi:hypothetical protein
MFTQTLCYVSQIGRESRVILQWKLQIPVGDSLANYSVSVWRTEASDNSLQPISGLLSAAKHNSFVDISTKFLDAQKNYSYMFKLHRVANITPERPAGVVAESDAISWDWPRDVVHEFIVGEHNFKFRHVSGVPVLVFNRMYDGNGVKCPNCWNPVIKKVMRSDCETCFGTGTPNGFYEPIYTWADLSPESNSTQIVEWGEKQPSQMDVIFSDYPRLRTKDIIVELGSGKHWAVVNSMNAEKRRSAMLQLIRLDLINPSDVEYKLNIPPDLIERASQELAELRNNKLTL